MSNWIYGTEEDVSLGDKGEVHIWISSDNNGNNYVYFEKEVFAKIIKKLGIKLVEYDEPEVLDEWRPF